MARYCPYCTSRITEGNQCTICNMKQTYTAMPNHLRPGTLLRGRYLIGTVLGEGGFGITYMGRDLALDMKVAVKEYYPSGIAIRVSSVSEEISVVNAGYQQDYYDGKKRVISEAQALAKLDKEGAVVTVRDFFEENNSAYIVMEFVEGSDLRRTINAKQKPMEIQKLLLLLEPVFSALHELHKIGLIHRDISPDNIMVEKETARLIDFGCTVPVRRDGRNISAVKHGFSPVEQYMNKKIGPWTDVYAMGATIYYCITGKVVPIATDRYQEDTLQPPSALGIKLKPKQERAIMRALALKPEDRFQSMEEFGKQIFIRKKNKYKIVAAAACLAAVLAVALWIAIPRNTTVQTLEVERNPKEIHYQSDSIGAEETKKLRLLSDLIKNNTQITAGDYGYYHVRMKNTTGYTYQNLYINGRFLTEDNTLLGTSFIQIDEWEQGMDTQENLVCSQEPDIIQLQVSYDVGNDRYVTEFITTSFSKSDNDISQQITVVNGLPQILTYSDYSGTAREYEISSIEISKGIASKMITVDGKYVKGPSELSGGMLNYRIISESGAVVKTGTIVIPDMMPGEQFENATAHVYDLPDGTYQLELYNYS